MTTARKSGFTLLELLAVMLIMFLLMGIGTVAMTGLVRGSGMSGAVTNVRSVLTQARQYAITQGQVTYVEFDETDNSMRVYARYRGGGSAPVATERFLPSGIQFAGGAAPAQVVFRPDGTTERPAGRYTVEVEEMYVANAQSAMLEVDGLTGWVH
jgi:Tfp pilus assembly protein FimT